MLVPTSCGHGHAVSTENDPNCRSLSEQIVNGEKRIWMMNSASIPAEIYIDVTSGVPLQ